MIQALIGLSILANVALFEPQRVDETRLTDNIVGRAMSHHPTVQKVSDKYGIPEWVLHGVMINETNASNIKSPGGGNYGLCQINCNVWLKTLKSLGLIDDCDDLLDPDKNLWATGHVLSHIRKLAKTDDWARILTLYHNGYRVKGIDKGYYSRVYFYGKNLMSQNPNRRTPWCKL